MTDTMSGITTKTRRKKDKITGEDEICFIQLKASLLAIFSITQF